MVRYIDAMHEAWFNVLLVDGGHAWEPKMNNLSDKAKNFLAQKPTMVGAVAGIRFYEHPVHGDESPLVMITTDGKVKTSGFYEVPDILELGYEVVRD